MEPGEHFYAVNAHTIDSFSFNEKMNDTTKEVGKIPESGSEAEKQLSTKN
jgi:hypothetical protein